MKKLSDQLKLRNSLLNFLQEDIGVGDITSNNLNNFNKLVKADIIYKSDFTGILCGLEEVEMLFDICNCNSKSIKSDGMSILPNEKTIEINGKAKDILKAERTALNLLMRMSGISTLTKKFVDIV